MDYARVVFAILGFAGSFVLFLPALKKQQKQEITREKLRMINEALESAEQCMVRYGDRHDRILSQICSYYLCHQELVDALVSARVSMNEALEFVVRLRKMQLKMLINFPQEVDLSMFDLPIPGVPQLSDTNK